MSDSGAPQFELATIGYQVATVESFRQALARGGIELLVDVRAVASSRRPGFAKTRLRGNVEEIGIEYMHVRALGTPADGRAAARAGQHGEMQRIFLEQLATPEAQAALEDLIQLIRSGRRLCLLCFEADPAHCHRNIVAAALAERLPLRITHLVPEPEPVY